MQRSRKSSFLSELFFDLLAVLPADLTADLTSALLEPVLPASYFTSWSCPPATFARSWLRPRVVEVFAISSSGVVAPVSTQPEPPGSIVDAMLMERNVGRGIIGRCC